MEALRPIVARRSHWRRLSGLTGRLRPYLVFVLCGVVLYPAVRDNYFDSTRQSVFDQKNKFSEDLVVGRLVQSRDEGIWSFQGRLGHHYFKESGVSEENEISLYEKKIHGGEFQTYNSQLGLQGIAFSLIDRSLAQWTKLRPESRLKALHSIAASSYAVVLSGIVTLLFLEFGAVPALTVAVSILLCQWMLFFGGNLYWLPSLMYLPFLIVLWCHWRESEGRPLEELFVYAPILGALFLKSSAGYEYISTILLSLLAPVVFYGYKDGWGWLRFVRRAAKVGMAGLLGFLVALFAHSIQLGASRGVPPWDALATVVEIAKTRSYGNASDFAAYAWLPNVKAWEKGADASILEVLERYWNGTVADFSMLFGRDYSAVWGYQDLVLLFAIATLGGLLMCRLSPPTSACRRKIVPLILATWFSVLAPLSWFVLAKVHSYVHTHINYLLWHLPFALLGFALVGLVVQEAWGRLWRTYGSLPGVVLAAVATIGAIGLMFWVHAASSKFDLAWDAKLETGERIVEGQRFDVYLLGSQLIYVRNHCAKRDIKPLFFLHLYPYKSTGQGQVPNREEFINMDFAADDYQEYVPLLSKYSGYCLLSRTLPDVPVRVIGTGQFVYQQLGARGGQYDIYWEGYHDMERSQTRSE